MIETVFHQIYQILTKSGVLKIIPANHTALNIFLNKNYKFKYLAVVSLCDFQFLSLLLVEITDKIYENTDFEAFFTENSIIFPLFNIKITFVTENSDEFEHES